MTPSDPTQSPQPTPPTPPMPELPVPELPVPELPVPKTPALTGLAFEVEYCPRVNFSLAQQGIRIVNRIALTNTSADPIDDITLELSFANRECDPWHAAIATIGPGQTYSLAPEQLIMDMATLATRTERERTTMTLRATSAGCEHHQRFEIELLAVDQWSGLAPYPELLATFITPNHPAVAPLLGIAREILRDRHEPEGIDGYQSASQRRAALLAQVCFESLCSHSLGYINPPASFEKQGQRVRLIDRVLREKQGTCLDLTLALAALLEQAGLNTVIVFFQDHVLPAVWTRNDRFPTVFLDEVEQLRNRIELGDLVPIESTMLTHANASFGDAVQTASRQLREGKDWVGAVDICTCRRLGVVPLPLRTNAEQVSEINPTPAADTLAGSHEPIALKAVELAMRAKQGAPSTEHDSRDPDRVARWKRKLLDLSLRNRLLSFRPSGRTLELLCANAGTLEDLLAAGKRFELRPRAPLRAAGRADESHDTNAREARSTHPDDDAFLHAELLDSRLYTNATAAITDKNLLTIYRAAKLNIEETGANVLYLALGMLKWYESPQAEKPRAAPLLLLPVKLIRSSGSGGYRYRIELGSEPIRPNITLIEKLRTEFGINVHNLDDLPEDESGIDVSLVFRRFRQAIESSPRWEVVESVQLGLFSFNKFLMWRDLQEHKENLTKNAVVAHLVNPARGVFEDQPMPAANHIDSEADDIFCTRDADSSQMVAVAAAAQGRTFVLEGPPGTGKSQTIANIIANSLAHGKRVLFVAEKMAALSVVRHRLERDGLGAFCLELHSAKASKKEVLKQLRESLDAAGLAKPDAWESTVASLKDTRASLQAYLDALHTPQPNNETLYEMIGRLSQLGEGPTTHPARAQLGQTNADELSRWRACIDDLVQAGGSVAPIAAHPLRGIGQSVWSFSLPEKAANALDTCSQTLAQQAGALMNICAELGVDGDLVRELSQTQLMCACAAVAMLAESPNPARGLLETPVSEIDALGEKLLAWIERDRAVRHARATLLARYQPELFSADILGYLDQATQARDKPGFVRWYFARKIKRSLRRFCLDRPGDMHALIADLQKALAIVREEQTLDDRADHLVNYLGPSWVRPKGQPDDALSKAFVSQVGWSRKFIHTLAALRSGSGSLLASALQLAASQPLPETLSQACCACAEAQAHSTTAHTHLTEVLKADLDRAASQDLNHERDDAPNTGFLPCAQAVLERWRTHLTGLNDWCRWQRACEQANAAELHDAVERLTQGTLTIDTLTDAFERGYGQRWLNQVADASDPIRTFNARAQSQCVQRFCQNDAQLISLTRTLVAARLAQRVPTGNHAVASASEVGLLQRELAKRSRHLPTRQLVNRLSHLLPRLKPCFLMSPLSVAQYLDADHEPFDLVIFDEASQIPVWDSIGSIARGKSLVVVGDSKQLPPTSFFHSQEDADDDVDPHELAADEELESILQECSASGFVSLGLAWHYRSRHESLITFSNHFYYNDQLQTFPSPAAHSPDLGVSLRLIEGAIYDRGNTRTNKLEAQSVVDEVVLRLTRDTNNQSNNKNNNAHTTKSIGIVTFNSNQQQLIEDMLDQVRRDRPELEPFFTDVDEPIFVKNLENVQGDERDIMLFSIGYGPDETGHMSMNFGPLNAEGGERRLNVAITRARYALVLFSSIGAEAIDLSRTRALGVQHFKRFLDYAARGPAAIAEALTQPVGASQGSGLEETIARMLTSRGWTVSQHVGQGSYRVDIAIAHPDDPSRFIVGIECDGPTYAKANTARDRDRTRPTVMQGLGWSLVRIWSVAWLVDSQSCLALIEDTIHAQLDKKQAAILHAASLADADVGVGTETETETETEVRAEPDDPLPNDSSDGPGCYVCATRPRGVRSTTDFYAGHNTDLAAEALEQIVEQEGPIVPELAAKRLAAWFGITRRTERYRARFEEILGRAALAGHIAARGDAYWPVCAPLPTQQANDGEKLKAFFAFLRQPGQDPATQRDINDIPQQERVAAVLWVLRKQIALPREDLAREAARLLGIDRVTSRTREILESAIEQTVGIGLATDEGQNIALPSG